MKGFQDELAELINIHSKENGSDTPDFLIAEFMVGMLNVFDAVLKRRDKWWKDEKQRERAPLP